jgi:6-phosphogluconolactonase/glucosamine-6-phosphate isomerase/deaminase
MMMTNAHCSSIFPSSSFSVRREQEEEKRRQTRAKEKMQRFMTICVCRACACDLVTRMSTGKTKKDVGVLSKKKRKKERED